MEILNHPNRKAPEASRIDDDATGEEWEPIRLGTLPEAAPFPIDVLPGPARDLAESVARSIPCPIDFPGVAALAAASGAIGRSVKLRIKGGYEQPASLYVALVGTPSSGKSPSLRLAMKPLWAISGRLYDKWLVETGRWEGEKKDQRGPSPALRRITSSDPTTEALGPILSDNPRGLIVLPDELTKLVMSMDQYKGGKGGDRPFWLSAWGGESICVDRAKNMSHPILCREPFLTVAAGLPPDMLSSLAEGRGRDDGFLARVLFCYPERQPQAHSQDEVSPSVEVAWTELIETLWNRKLLDATDGPPAPHIVEMTPEARSVYNRWCEWHCEEQNADDFPASLEGTWGKLRAYMPRLALILHTTRIAADRSYSPELPPPDLPASMIDDAARLVEYFKQHARRTYASMGGRQSDGGADVLALVKWIGRGRVESFTNRDVGRNFNRFDHDNAALADALAWMIGHHLIRPASPPEGRKTGRKPSPGFDVNPGLFTNPRYRHLWGETRAVLVSGGNVGNAGDP